MNATTSTTAPAWTALEALDKFKQTGPSQFEACCPAHHDRHPSLSIRIGDDGRILLTCHGPCDTPSVVAALGCELADLFPPKATDSVAQAKPRIVETYPYRDEAGTLLYQAVRYEPKHFKQRRPDGHGGWLWNLAGVRRVPYRLPELLADTSGKLWLFEGEKDANRAAALGLNATTTAQGAGSFEKTAEAMRTVAKGRHVFIVPDEDDGGNTYGTAALVALKPVAPSVRVVRLPRLTHTADHGEDFSDWLETYGGSVEELRTLVEERSGGPEQEDDTDDDDGDEQEEEDDANDPENDPAAAALAATPAAPQVRPLVQINHVQLRRPVLATLGALREVNQHREVPVLFARGGTLVRVACR
jgi:putative DNA primase/helicase